MQYLKTFTIALLASLASTAAVSESQAPTGTYINDPGHTRLLWKIQHLGLSNYTARVNDVAITLQFDANDMTRSEVTAVIDPMSVDTGYVGEEDFDRKISENEEILNAGKFPEIRFVSTGVRSLDDSRMAVDGELTLLGVTQSVTLEATLTGSSAEHPFAKVPALGFHATASLDRTSFGQSFLSGVALGDIVEIEIQTELLKQN